MKHASCPTCDRELDSRHTEMVNLPATVVCSACGSWMRLDARSSSLLVKGALVTGTLAVAWVIPVVLILLPVYLVLYSGSSARVKVTPVDKRPAKLWTINRESGTMECLSDAELEGAMTRELKRDPLSARFAVMKPFENPNPPQGAPDRRALRESKRETAFVSGDFGSRRPRELPH